MFQAKPKRSKRHQIFVSGLTDTSTPSLITSFFWRVFGFEVLCTSPGIFPWEPKYTNGLGKLEVRTYKQKRRLLKADSYSIGGTTLTVSNFLSKSELEEQRFKLASRRILIASKNLGHHDLYSSFA